MSEKCLLDQWRDMAYDRSLSKDQLEKFWGRYFNIEKEIYEQLLDDPDNAVSLNFLSRGCPTGFEHFDFPEVSGKGFTSGVLSAGLGKKSKMAELRQRGPELSVEKLIRH